jgi:hypothetical protein
MRVFRDISHLQWLRDLLLGTPPPAVPPLDALVAEPAAEWPADSSIVEHIVRLYALEHRVSLQAALDALRGLDLDEAKTEVGET